jgi:hypothetical protein
MTYPTPGWQKKMAGAAGIEPAHDGIKTRCLTAWLRPNNLYWIIFVRRTSESK